MPLNIIKGVLPISVMEALILTSGVNQKMAGCLSAAVVDFRQCISMYLHTWSKLLSTDLSSSCHFSPSSHFFPRTLMTVFPYCHKLCLLVSPLILSSLFFGGFSHCNPNLSLASETQVTVRSQASQVQGLRSETLHVNLIHSAVQSHTGCVWQCGVQNQP